MRFICSHNIILVLSLSFYYCGTAHVFVCLCLLLHCVLFCSAGAFIHKRCAPSDSCVCLPVFVFAPPTLPLFVVFPFCVTARSIVVAHCFTYVYVVMCNPLSCASCSSFVQPAVRGQSDKGRGQLRLTVSVSGIKQQVASNGCR